MRLSTSRFVLPLSLASLTSAVPLTTVLSQNSATLSTLSSLLSTVPDLVNALGSASNITILAPSNTAFTNLMQRNPRSAELANNPTALTGVLQYHVLMGKIASTDFSTTPKFAQTMLMMPFANVTGGQRLELVKVNNSAMVFSGFKQMAMVTTADVAFDGGVVHILDTVLTVPAPPSDTAIDTGLTSLAGALTAVQLVDAVDSATDITVFAPSNAAFQAIGGGLGSLTSTDVQNLLKYHVLSGQVKFSTDLEAASTTLTTLTGGTVTVRKQNGQLFVNSARVVVADILMSNGVVHVIDNVLNPSNTTVTPNPSLSTELPAFAAVTPAAEAPFTSGISATTTFVPATVPLNAAGPFASIPTAALMVAGGAMAIAANL